MKKRKIFAALLAVCVSLTSMQSATILAAEETDFAEAADSFCDMENEADSAEEEAFLQEELPDEEEHSYGDWEIVSEGDCLTKGQERRICVNCGYVETRETVPGAHKWEEWQIEKKADCYHKGLESRSCIVCKISESKDIPKTKHKWSKWYLDYPAMMTRDGYESRTCSICSDYEDRIVCRLKSVTLSKSSFTYNGKVQKPAVTVKDTENKVISPSDYDLKYSSGCTNAGTYTVKVVFKNNYLGEERLNFKITKGTQKLSATDQSLAVGETLSLKPSHTGDGKLTYKSSNTRVAVVSSSGKITAKGFGKATITITAGSTKNCNSASTKITVNVRPKGTSITSAKNSAAGKVSVSWKRNTDVSGYQIQYADNSKFKNAKLTAITRNSTFKATLSGLKKNKDCYIRIRTYKTLSGKKYYSDWSKAVKVGIKK